VPREGSTLARSPRAVALTFSESVDPKLVKLDLRDEAGRSVARGDPYHPGGRDEVVAIDLAPRLEGRLVAHYRVISEDGHPVAHALRFRVRERPATEPSGGEPTPAPTETAAPPPARSPPQSGDTPTRRAGRQSPEAL
jgi:methionine-rich copper-binding protein CopC